MIFTVNELAGCGVLRPDRFDGGGFFQTTHIHLLPKNTVVYNFIHLTVQEFFCAFHVALLPSNINLFMNISQIFLICFVITLVYPDCCPLKFLVSFAQN